MLVPSFKALEVMRKCKCICLVSMHRKQYTSRKGASSIPQKRHAVRKKKPDRMKILVLQRSVLCKQMAPEVIMETENTSPFVHFVTKVVYLILCCV